MIKFFLYFLCFLAFLENGHCYPSSQPESSENQTPYVSSVYPAEDLPFEVEITTSSLSLPVGLQSYAFAVHKNKWLLVSGRTGGLHGFSVGDENFPVSEQNTSVFVVDLKKKKVYQKSLFHKTSHLSVKQIEALSVVSPQYKQVGNTLYVIGGYGPDSETDDFNTKPTLTAIDIPGLIRWVEKSEGSAKENIRQIHNPIFQVTGGQCDQTDPHSPFLLIFGQNFDGFYSSGSNGTYTEQVRTFRLIDDGNFLGVFGEEYKTSNPSYRRRDLNIVPIIQIKKKMYEQSFLALSGVFTLEGGVWTVPVFISQDGRTSMSNPSKSSTFKQGMNNYNSAHMGLFSAEANTMHTVVFGGLSYETYVDGVFEFDQEIPFTNNVTSVKIDAKGQMTQHLLEATYPIIFSTDVNPGNQLLFGAGARFVSASNPSSFSNGVFSLDTIKEKTLIGYIVGGIQSTLPNTSSPADSSPSAYIFEVFVKPR